MGSRTAVGIRPDVWIDPAWHNLTYHAQWLYVLLLGQERPTNAPWVDYAPEAWLTLVAGAHRGLIDLALEDLDEAGLVYVVADRVYLRELTNFTLPTAATHVERERARITLAVRRRVIARDGALCRFCGVTDDLTIDHVLALTRGGTSDDDNLAILCRPCNSRKGTKPWEQFVREETRRRARAGVVV
jgi:hypothetical protein